MKQVSISEDAWKTLSLLKLQKELRSLADTLDLILKERKQKGGNNKNGTIQTKVQTTRNN